MKCWILIFVCGAFADVSVPTQLPLLVPETLTDLPYGSIEDFDSVTMQARQNEIEGEVQLEAETEAPVSTTTVHFTKLACTGDNYEWNSCGPRCYQTCVFQPRENIRAAKAVCESATSTGCHPGCFCKSGFVRLNDQCILPVECPTRSCGNNEDYLHCGTACPITCDSYSNATEIESQCPSAICIRGCFCKHGFVRSAMGLCVLPTRCPRPLII